MWTRNVRVIGSAWGWSLPRTRPVALTEGSSVKVTTISGSGGAAADSYRATIKHGVAPVLAGDLGSPSVGLHDFASLGAAGRD